MQWPVQTLDLIDAWATRFGGNPGLVALFMDAQFSAFPADWCTKAFGRPYPPPSIVFGDGAEERYQQVIRSGKSFVQR